jgi:ABC-type protease/lipase transport system fused ATPase/permease subunit
VVVVSHRPALLGQADNVLRLADGGVERFGPRDEVLRALAEERPLHLVNGKREVTP